MKVGWLGDVHCDPNHDTTFQRLKDAGRYLAAEKCDVVCQIGDWYDMPSITEHRGRLEREGDRYKLDIEAGNEGLAAFMRPFHRRKKKLPPLRLHRGEP